MIARPIVEVVEYHPGVESGWETVRGIGKLNRDAITNVVKSYCGKSFKGKTFRVAYLDLPTGRFWIKPVLG